MYKVVLTKPLNKCLRELKTCGKKGKDAITKTRAAQAEAATEGKIESIQRTNHGESRIENAEKYDLGNGYRLVVQLIDGVSKTRAFLYAGDHDDTERWLDNHKNYKWVKSEKDDTLVFVQVTESKSADSKFVDMDLDSSEAIRDLPLLRHIENQEWSSLAFPSDLKQYLMSIKPEDWECDPNGILDHVEKLSDTEMAILVDDLLSLSHSFQFAELHKRVALHIGDASITNGEKLVDAIISPENSEIFVTWEELDRLPENSSWSDWLLFLHPEQRELANKDFKGAARLRGVSGSGKTCVMLHRARYLAKKYRKPILLVTLTESMRKLLDSLILELCGVEAPLIETSTIQGLAHRIVKDLHPKGESAYQAIRKSDNDLINEINGQVLEFVKNHEYFSSTGLSKSSYMEVKRFVEEEIYFIRSRLLSSQFEQYLDVKSFKRHGRGRALKADARRVFFEAANLKADLMKEVFKIDHEGVVSAACSLLLNDPASIEKFGWAEVSSQSLEKNLSQFSPYRCVLVDEVQDLSQLEITMIAAMDSGEGRISSQEDGLFLVGDGAQTIYNKGFVLKRCGVNVSNRSYVLIKNYRNSKEIMEASYSLIEKYEFADVDEDNIIKPTKPDLPTTVGERPFIVKCRNEKDEVEFVSETIEKIIATAYEEEDVGAYPEICVIGLNKRTRDIIASALAERQIETCELKQSANTDRSDSIKISTIESAKGHEFQHVFIVGVIEGAMPTKSALENDIAREASRLYVAMTRARDTLYITYNISKGTLPSRFLIDIQDHANEYDCRELKLEALV